MGTSVIRADGLSKNYGAVPALRNLDLEVADGEVIGYLGPNGPARRPRSGCCWGLSGPLRAVRRSSGWTASAGRWRRTGGWLTWRARPAHGRR